MLQLILDELAKTNTTLIAVSKTKPTKQIMQMYDRGQRIFGENRVQELLEKYESLPKDIQWHLIGHLQTNKVKYIAPFVHMIQSVDSFKLLEEINKQAAKHKRTISVLLQFHIAEEDSKFGFALNDLVELIDKESFKDLKNIRLAGVMGMATFTDDMDQVRLEFSLLKHIFTQLKNQYFDNSPHFKEISMGMSGDFRIAIEEGSTMVRIGSLLFGGRN